ncbi:MAG: hypothetical protein ACYSTS_15290 [Planctomycetota bacterium]|jgi:hypothetical protein
MDQEIESLYGDSDFVGIHLTTKSLPLVSYQVHGLGDSIKKEYAEQWKITGGVEGTFSYDIYGKVSDPGIWKGYNTQLMVNSVGSSFRADHEPEGFLGDGWCEKKRVLLRLHVKPQIARDILDKLFYFNKVEGEEEHSLRCDVVNLKRSSGLDEEAISYQIVRIYC